VSWIVETARATAGPSVPGMTISTIAMRNGLPEVAAV